MPDQTSDSQVLTLAHPMLLGKACPVSPSTKTAPVWPRPRGASEDSLAPFSTWDSLTPAVASSVPSFKAGQTLPLPVGSSNG